MKKIKRKNKPKKQMRDKNEINTFKLNWDDQKANSTRAQESERYTKRLERHIPSAYSTFAYIIIFHILFYVAFFR